MATIIRLTAYPLANLTHLAGFVPSPDTSPHISCLLHAGFPHSGQRLEVRVQDIELQGKHEDDQQVFSWRCAKGEAIRLTLWSRGRRGREWLGCWNGEQALLHTGTLPVQVTFSGQMQPEVDPADLVPWLAVSEHNGHTTEQDAPTDLLVLAQAPTHDREGIPETGSADHAVVFQEGADSSHDDPDGRDEASQEEARSFPFAEATTDVPSTEVLHAAETATAPTLEAPAGTQLATWHADPTGTESALEALTMQIAQMPTKTLLVDLRQHPRKAARSQETGPLSKQTLRQTFGARYWDRGWAIRTVQRLHPDQARARLCTVITNPHDPEGLPLLVDRLHRGYSLLLIDRIATYEESTRAAVITELRQQIGDLTFGQLS